jgi:hypothetical protein
MELLAMDEALEITVSILVRPWFSYLEESLQLDVVHIIGILSISTRKEGRCTLAHLIQPTVNGYRLKKKSVNARCKTRLDR